MNDTNRDAFEDAYCATTGTETIKWYLAEHRVSDDLYLFESEMLTGMVNAAYWGWRAGQQTMATCMEGRGHVMH